MGNMYKDVAAFFSCLSGLGDGERAAVLPAVFESYALESGGREPRGEGTFEFWERLCNEFESPSLLEGMAVRLRPWYEGGGEGAEQRSGVVRGFVKGILEEVEGGGEMGKVRGFGNPFLYA